MSTTPMSDEQRREFLAGLGLSPDAPGLTEPTQVAATVSAPAATAPAGPDPHTMPVPDIVFDERLLEPFGDLEGENYAAASRAVFAAYKSPGRDKTRNSLLHRRITEWLGQVRRQRKTGGHVKEAVKTTREQRDLAALLAAQGITAADLAALLPASTPEGTEPIA